MSPSSDSGALNEKLISEPVTPVAGSFNTAAMATGSPGVPMAFVWRGKEYRVARIMAERKTLRGCRNGSGEKYIDKHIFTVKAESGETMTLYRARTGSKGDSWVLYTIANESEGVRPMRIAVLVSGGGTNLQALIDAEEAQRAGAIGAGGQCAEGGRYEIAIVIADRECFALERARKNGIKAVIASAPKGIPRVEARRFVSDRVLELVREARVDAIVLAGFLTIMSGDVIKEYAERIVNLHPALLPKFGGEGMWGHHVHEAVLASEDAESGCTIHLVDSGCDTGPILFQKRVPVLPGDTPETLAARIAGEEHVAIVEGVRELARRLSEKAKSAD